MTSLALVLAGALTAFPAAAFAATYYVGIGGSDANTGTSVNTPWATVSKANTQLVAGDVCILLPGVYGQPVAPVNSGTPTARITYVGNIGNPRAVTVSSIDVSASYVSVKGMEALQGGFLSYSNEANAARYDSIAWCVLDNGGAFVGSKHCMMAHNTIHGAFAFIMDHWAPKAPATSNAEFDTLRGNDIDHGDISAIPDLRAFKIRGCTQRCLLDSNRVSGLFAGPNVDQFGRLVYNSYWNTFRDNRWTYEAANTRGTEPWDTISLRDSSSHNLFERDTTLCGLGSVYPVRARLTSAGSWPGTTFGNIWRDCTIKTTAYLWCQDVMDSSLIEGCTFVSKDSWALWAMAPLKNVTMRHNTFKTGGPTALWVDGDTRPGGNVLTSNIFYGGAAPTCIDPIVHFRYGTGVRSDFNLYYSPAGASPAGNAINLAGACSPPGSGQPWNLQTGQDGHSKFGSPRFADSTFSTFNPVLRAGSMAIGTGEGGSNAGIVPFAAGVDATPPSAITDLTAAQIGDHHVVLAWTAPGDDGTAGTAAGYDLRWSTSPITAATFAAATPVAVQPVPSAPGVAERYVLTGLSPGASYSFAIRARDEANNWSAVSNVRPAVTASADLTPPLGVQDLAATP